MKKLREDRRAQIGTLALTVAARLKHSCGFGLQFQLPPEPANLLSSHTLSTPPSCRIEMIPDQVFL